MVSNRDGLGRLALSWERFRTAQNRIDGNIAKWRVSCLPLSDVPLDRHYASEKAPTRKTGTGLFTAYMNADHDLEKSHRDRRPDSDIRLAKHLHAESVLSGNTVPMRTFSARSWKAIADLLIRPEPEADRSLRKTRETEISKYGSILTAAARRIFPPASGFIDDRMLELFFAKHAGTDCRRNVRGDLHVDTHHTV
ncbi:MAG: hypothetical protein U5N26_07625 [Candidatus Marinimicrobia bacterium]|nr:hypothetical protein [Candidatus Neomarinimicrobiota bacterium]